MNILYISRLNLFSERAHAYTVTRTCEAMNFVPDTNVTLAVTDSAAAQEDERRRYFEFHGVRAPFGLQAIGTWAEPLKHSKNSLVFNLSTIAANLSFGWFVMRNSRKFETLYYRDHLLVVPVVLARLLGKKTIFEAHYVLDNKMSQWIADRMAVLSSGVVAISKSLEDYYVKLNPHVLMSFCAAAEPERFAGISETSPSLRDALGLPVQKTILMYTGNIGRTGIGDTYGVEDIVQAMPKIPDETVFVVVGKRPETKSLPEAAAENLSLSDRVLFVPWQDRNVIARYITAADILVIPRSGAKPGNSPTKMFEYLASGRPVIAARTKPIEEVLEDGRTALLVDYAAPDEWARAVTRILSDRPLRETLVKNALGESGKYTWQKRGEMIIAFIGKLQ